MSTKEEASSLWLFHSHLTLYCSSPGRVYEEEDYYPRYPCYAFWIPCAPRAVTGGCDHRGCIIMGKFLLYIQNPCTINWSQSSFEGYCLGCDILQGLLCTLSNICKEWCAQNLPIVLVRKCPCTYE